MEVHFLLILRIKPYCETGNEGEENGMKALTHGGFRAKGGPWDEGRKEGER